MHFILLEEKGYGKWGRSLLIALELHNLFRQGPRVMISLIIFPIISHWENAIKVHIQV